MSSGQELQRQGSTRVGLSSYFRDFEGGKPEGRGWLTCNFCLRFYKISVVYE